MAYLHVWVRSDHFDVACPVFRSCGFASSSFPARV
jgi:hypothetical protein